MGVCVWWGRLVGGERQKLATERTVQDDNYNPLHPSHPPLHPPHNPPLVSHSRPLVGAGHSIDGRVRGAPEHLPRQGGALLRKGAGAGVDGVGALGRLPGVRLGLLASLAEELGAIPKNIRDQLGDGAPEQRCPRAVGAGLGGGEQAEEDGRDRHLAFFQLFVASDRPPRADVDIG